MHAKNVAEPLDHQNDGYTLQYTEGKLNRIFRNSLHAPQDERYLSSIAAIGNWQEISLFCFIQKE